MSTLQKLLEAHIEKAAEKYVDQIPEDYAVTECEVEVGYKAGAQSLAPLVQQLAWALEKDYEVHGSTYAANALAALAASLKREGA